MPPSTLFVGGLHTTTTDDMLLYDTDLLPASHQSDLDALRGWLVEAGKRARAERRTAQPQPAYEPRRPQLPA